MMIFLAFSWRDAKILPHGSKGTRLTVVVYPCCIHCKWWAEDDGRQVRAGKAVCKELLRVPSCAVFSVYGYEARCVWRVASRVALVWGTSVDIHDIWLMPPNRRSTGSKARLGVCVPSWSGESLPAYLLALLYLPT